MQYLGGKFAIRKQLGAFLTEQAKGKDFFLDLFCGAGNVVSNVQHPNRHANDASRYIIAVLKRAQRGGEFPDCVTEDFYRDVKNNTDAYPDWLVGFVGFGCSFGGKFFRGYARRTKHHNFAAAAARSYATSAANSFQNVSFQNVSFQNVSFSEGSGLIYCDPPYENTTGYHVGQFDTEAFYRWAREQAQRHTVLVSEYEHNARGPVVWHQASRQCLRSKSGVLKTSEVVFQVLP